MGLLRAIAWVSVSVLPLAVAVTMPAAQGAKPNEGPALFQQKCAPCHGPNGQGGAGYSKPLAGKLTKVAMAAFIHKSMPPGGPVTTPTQAAKIASFAYDSFYSPIAQARIAPPRVELARLTVTQFKNAVTDLISGFHSAIPGNGTHGIHGEYFKGRSRDSKNEAFQRTDPNIDFDFGTGAPNDKDFDPRNFSISWQGSVLAPDTGEYEFSIHSRHSCQLWVNDTQYPTVDGEVRSAGDPDPSGAVTLLGGRAYTIRMVFTKATQGVDDADKKNKKPSGPSYVSLRWRRPNHVEEAIPTQFLFPDPASKSYVDTTPFPPDDRSTGYDRGDSVSREWDDAVTSAAISAATYTAKNLEEVTHVADNDKNRTDDLKVFCSDFLTRAFRRPLTPDIRSVYIDKQFQSVSNLNEAVKRVVFLGLKSPRFLYREISAKPHDPYFVASQLSFGLWDTIPDPELEQAAAKGNLATTDQVEAQADRMTHDNRAWSKLRQFLLFWLKVDEVPDILKNPKVYPSFDATVASDLRTSLELYLQNTAWDQDANYRDLMLSPDEFLNGRLAQLYGVALPANAPFQSIQLDPDKRAGVLTNPYLLSRFAYLDTSSPIHRGVLIVRNLLGRILNPPPQNFIPLAAAAHPNLTTRERVSLQTKPQFCTNCHGIINPLGFTLEEFDAIGKVRTSENGKLVDCSGTYRDKSGTLVKFTGAKDLANYLADSDDAHDAFVTKLFLNVAKQPPLAYGPQTLPNLERSFSANRYSIRSLLVNMVTTTAMLPLATGKGG
jgi:hypothetical protein